MSTREFPRFGGGQELTAAQVNAILDQMRRQARIYATPPLDAIQSPEGWLVRLNTPSGFWAEVGERVATEDGPRYAYAETATDGFGGWHPLPGGRSAEAAGGAVEVNGRTDIEPGTVVWMTENQGTPVTAGSAAFEGPPVEGVAAPLYFWARLESAADGEYDYTPLRYGPNGFEDDEAALAEVAGAGPALEANGRTDAAIGNVVLMRVDPAPDSQPVFSVSATSAGYWAKVGPMPTVVELELTLANRFTKDPPWPAPVGGTWKINLFDAFGAVTSVTSRPIAFDATVDEVQAAVDALTPPVVYGSLAVSGTDGGPWSFRFQNEWAGLSGVQFDTTGLDYGDAPPQSGGSFTAGPFGGYLSVQQTGGGNVYLEVERSKGGSWYVAREPRTPGVPVVPDNADTTALPQGVYFIEPGGTTNSGNVVTPAVSGTDFDLLDGGGSPIDYGSQTAVAVTQDGVGSFVAVTGASSGTFRLVHKGYPSLPIAFDATATEVADAVNGGLPAGFGGFYNVAGTLGPLGSGVRLDWADPTVGEVQATVTRYVNQRNYAEPSNWLSTGRGHSRVATAGYKLSEVWELRTYHPTGDTPRPTGGTFKLAYGTLVTGEIAFDAACQDVQDELEPLAGRGNLYCDGGPLPAPVRVYFQGDLAGEVTDGLSVSSSDLSGDPVGGVGPAVTVFQPQSLLVRSHGPTHPTANTAPYTLTLDGHPAATDWPASGGDLAAFIGANFPTVGRRRLFGQGDAGGPVRVVWKDVLATAPPAASVAVPPGSPYTMEATAGQAAGKSGSPDGGTVKLCVGAQWRLDMAGSGTVHASVNGVTVNQFNQPIVLTNGMSPADVAAALATAEVAGVGQGQGFAATWVAGGGPLGTRPVYLFLNGWPCNRTIELAVVSTTTDAPPAAAAVRMTAVMREEFADDAYYLEVSSSSPGAVAGTWTMPQLVGATAAPVLPYNATAAQVLAAVTGFTRTVGLGGPSPFTFQPFSDATASGGPLPGTPVVVRIPTGPTAQWRKYVGGLNTSAPVDQLFAVNAAGLTAPPVPNPAVTAGFTWLGTGDLDVTALTPVAVESALRATPFGGLVRCAAAADTVGGVVLAIPDYAGEVDLGNKGHLFSAFGYADGGRLRFYSNACPQDAEGVVSPPVSPATGEADGAWTVGAVDSSPFQGLPHRADEGGRWIAAQPFRAQLLGIAWNGLTNQGMTNYYPDYPWVELAPGPGRTPRSDDAAYMAYNGVNDFTAGVQLFTPNNGIPAYAARELSGNNYVPYRAEVWLDPAAGYAFTWAADRPVPRYARAYTSAAWLPGVIADTFDTLHSVFVGYQARLVLEADPADPRTNSGRVFNGPLPLTQGRYTGAFPTAATPPAGVTPPPFTAPNWQVPTPTTPTTDGTVTPLLSAASYFFDDPNTVEGGSSAIAILSNNFSQYVGSGDKAVAGAVYLFGNSNQNAFGGSFPGLAASWNAVTGVTTPTAVTPNWGVPGRSLQVSITLGLEADHNSPCNLHLGSWGTVGPFSLNSPPSYVQGLLDALLGPDQGRVIDIMSDGFHYGWTFYFAGGDFGRKDPGAVTTDLPFTLNIDTTPVEIADGTWDGIQAAAETIWCRAGTGGGGLRYDDYWSGAAANPLLGTPHWYYTLRHLSMAGVVGPGVSVQNHQGAGNSGFLGDTVGAGCTIEVGAGTQEFPFPGEAVPGSRLILPGHVPLECGAGRGYWHCCVGNYTGGPYGVNSSAPGGYGCGFEFHGGLCTDAVFRDPSPAVYTGTFPTHDGRTATVVKGYIVSVA